MNLTFIQDTKKTGTNVTLSKINFTKCNELCELGELLVYRVHVNNKGKRSTPLLYIFLVLSVPYYEYINKCNYIYMVSS